MRTIMNYVLWLILLTGLAGGPSCTKKYMVDTAADSSYLGRLPIPIADNFSFSDFYSALQTTGWLDTIAGTGPYTVVLPDNDAYNAGYSSPYSNGSALTGFIYAQCTGAQTLSGSVGYELLGGRVSFRSLPLGVNQELRSLTGKVQYVTRYLSGIDTATTVDGQLLISLDNPATNGLIQVAGGIPNPELYPTVLQQIQSDTNLTFFAAALQRTHLDTLLLGPGPFTVLAPSNFGLENASGFGLHLGLNLSSLDSVLAADPVALTHFVAYHILPGRYYLNDLLRQLLTNTDTLKLTMLNGEIVSFTDPPGNSNFPLSNFIPTFYGSGNSYGATLYGEQTDIPVGADYGLYYRNCGDLTAGNGVVQTLYVPLVP